MEPAFIVLLFNEPTWEVLLVVDFVLVVYLFLGLSLYVPFYVVLALVHEVLLLFSPGSATYYSMSQCR